MQDKKKLIESMENLIRYPILNIAISGAAAKTNNKFTKPCRWQTSTKSYPTSRTPTKVRKPSPSPQKNNTITDCRAPVQQPRTAAKILCGHGYCLYGWQGTSIKIQIVLSCKFPRAIVSDEMLMKDVVGLLKGPEE